VPDAPSTRSEWAPLLDRLHAHPALSTLALDLRGHGASTAGPDGTTLSYATFDAAAWAGTAQDVLAAVAYVRSSAPDAVAELRLVLDFGELMLALLTHPHAPTLPLDRADADPAAAAAAAAAGAACGARRCPPASRCWRRACTRG
jgi:pimeloyl-ACP methyl ester carboxylesterase